MRYSPVRNAAEAESFHRMNEMGLPWRYPRALFPAKQLFDVVYFYDDDQHNIDMADQVGVKTYLI